MFLSGQERVKVDGRHDLMRGSLLAVQVLELPGEIAAQSNANEGFPQAVCPQVVVVVVVVESFPTKTTIILDVVDVVLVL